jgi:predicted small metal-binding protein
MEAVMPVYSYACKDYPGMEKCPGQFHAEAEAELWKHIELHAKLAHDENPEAWSSEERAQIKALVVVTAGGAS